MSLESGLVSVNAEFCYIIRKITPISDEMSAYEIT